MVSDAGISVCRIMGTATRGTSTGCTWTQAFRRHHRDGRRAQYKIRTDRAGPDIPWNVAGPTCDSIDVVMPTTASLPDLQDGDYISFRTPALDTTAYASNFNGFPLPEYGI